MAKKKTEDAISVEAGTDAVVNENTETSVNETETAAQSEDIPEVPVEKKTRASKKKSESETETAAQSEDIPEVPVEKKTRASKKKSESETETAAQSEDIPEDVKAVLKCYPEEAELYVSKYGGTFPKDSEPFVRGNAILYKNPFYKS